METTIADSSIMIHFSTMTDPRKPRNQRYSLFDIISTAILATLCGSDDYSSISYWTQENLEWLQSVEICPEGAPCHDTYERFFRILDPKQFQSCFIAWTQQITKAVKGVIALDGKTLRGSGDKANNLRPVHLVSAFSAENELVLGQLKTDNKGGELRTFHLLLELLDLRGATVTIDAAGCHKTLAHSVHEKGGNYILALKGNQGKLFAETKNFFVQALGVEAEEAGCDYCSWEERVRGGTTTREVWATDQIDWLPELGEWQALKSLICVRTTRKKGEKVSSECRYFISSHQASAHGLGKAIRSHWSIENKLHWHLDVTFNEDLSRVRKGHGAENLSVLRRSTLNILRTDKGTKASMRNRRLKAGWKRDYLLELLNAN